MVVGKHLAGVLTNKPLRYKRGPRKQTRQCSEAPKPESKSKSKQQIERARARNQYNSRQGRVRLCKLHHFRDKSVKDKRWKRRKGYRNISVCSGAKKWKVVSPMYIGPVEHGEIGAPPAKSLDNLVRYSLVWEHEFDRALGQPTQEWYQRRAAGFALPQGERYTSGSFKRQLHTHKQPIGSWWGGRLLSIVAARIELECKLYARLVKTVPLYHDLELMVHDGYNLQLFGYDAFDLDAEHMHPLEVLRDTSLRFGHEFVLYGLLKNQLFWEDL